MDCRYITKFAIPKDEKKPHQSRLGNSSNIYEMPRQAFVSNGGPQPTCRCFYARRITKDRKPSNPDYRSFIVSLWCGPYRRGRAPMVCGLLFFCPRVRPYISDCFPILIHPPTWDYHQTEFWHTLPFLCPGWPDGGRWVLLTAVAAVAWVTAGGRCGCVKMGCWILKNVYWENLVKELFFCVS